MLKLKINNQVLKNINKMLIFKLLLNYQWDLDQLQHLQNKILNSYNLEKIEDCQSNQRKLPRNTKHLMTF